MNGDDWIALSRMLAGLDETIRRITGAADATGALLHIADKLDVCAANLRQRASGNPIAAATITGMQARAQRARALAPIFAPLGSEAFR